MIDILSKIQMISFELTKLEIQLPVLYLKEIHWLDDLDIL